REFVDTIDKQFFARLVANPGFDIDEIHKALQEVLPADAYIKVNPQPEKKVVLLVTKEYHCLSDILVRNHFQTLGASVQAVIGNHDVLKNICDRFDIPFFYVSHENKEKSDFEQEIISIVKEHEFDYLVLAKFMRILS